MRRFKSLPKLSKCRSYGAGELVGAGRRHHALRGAHKQRVSKTCSQPGNGIAEGRLTQPNLSCGTAHMPLVDQRFKSHEEVQVDSTYIHSANITYHAYPFHK